MVQLHYCVTGMEHVTVNNMPAFYRPCHVEWRPSLLLQIRFETNAICYERHVV